MTYNARAKAIIDALADADVDNARALRIVERYGATGGAALTNEQKSQVFVERLTATIRATIRCQAERDTMAAHQDEVTAAEGDL